MDRNSLAGVLESSLSRTQTIQNALALGSKYIFEHISEFQLDVEFKKKNNDKLLQQIQEQKIEAQATADNEREEEYKKIALHYGQELLKYKQMLEPGADVGTICANWLWVQKDAKHLL